MPPFESIDNHRVEPRRWCCFDQDVRHCSEYFAFSDSAFRLSAAATGVWVFKVWKHVSHNANGNTVELIITAGTTQPRGGFYNGGTRLMVGGSRPVHRCVRQWCYGENADVDVDVDVHARGPRSIDRTYVSSVCVMSDI